MEIGHRRRELIRHVRVVRPEKGAESALRRGRNEAVERGNEGAIVVLSVDALQIAPFEDFRKSPLPQEVPLADEGDFAVADEGGSHPQSAPALGYRIERDPLLASREGLPEWSRVDTEEQGLQPFDAERLVRVGAGEDGGVGRKRGEARERRGLSRWPEELRAAPLEEGSERTAASPASERWMEIGLDRGRAARPRRMQPDPARQAASVPRCALPPAVSKRLAPRAGQSRREPTKPRA